MPDSKTPKPSSEDISVLKPDRTAGHINIYSGKAPKFNKKHLLGLIEKVAESKIDDLPNGFINVLQTPFDYYGENEDEELYATVFSVVGNLKLHTDCVGYDEMTIGMILIANDDLELYTGRKKTPAKVGDVFILNPFKMHGARHTGLLVFAALDYVPESEKYYGQKMSPDVFRAMLDRDMKFREDKRKRL